MSVASTRTIHPFRAKIAAIITNNLILWQLSTMSLTISHHDSERIRLWLSGWLFDWAARTHSPKMIYKLDVRSLTSISDSRRHSSSSCSLPQSYLMKLSQVSQCMLYSTRNVRSAFDVNKINILKLISGEVAGEKSVHIADSPKSCTYRNQWMSKSSHTIQKQTKIGVCKCVSASARARVCA